MYIDPTSITETSYTSYLVKGGCTWMVENTMEPTHSGPAVPYGHYSLADSASQEGNCKPDTKYDDVGIYPSGLPWMEYGIQDWESGEILAILRWDGTTYNGYDNEGNIIHGIIDMGDNETATQWSGIYGHRGACIWSITYDYAFDHPVLPNIPDTVPAESEWHFHDAYGIWNSDFKGSDDDSCGEDEDELEDRYDSLICVWPNGPAVLNLVQCNDDRDDYHTILQQVWWRGKAQAWVGTDYAHSYTWGYDDNDGGDYEEDTFILQGTADSGCTFTIRMTRGDDCETIGWKVGISVLSVLCALLLIVILYLVTQGGGGGGGGGYHEYQ